ncbi:MAG: PAS domain S-box protein [bacterium]|nr:PAS domain S-box protein [bacterium]
MIEKDGINDNNSYYQQQFESLDLLLENSHKEQQEFLEEVCRGLKKIFSLSGIGILLKERGNNKDRYTFLKAISIPEKTIMEKLISGDPDLMIDLPGYVCAPLAETGLILVAKKDTVDSDITGLGSEKFIQHFTNIIQKQQRAPLEKSYRDYFLHSPALLFKVNIDGVCIEANDACRQLLKRTSEITTDPNNLIGATFDQIIIPKDVESMAAKYQDLIQRVLAYIKKEKSRRQINLEEIISNAKKMSLGVEPVEFLTWNGKVLYCEVDACCTIDDEGTITGFHCTAFDKAKLRRTEEALRISEERYKTLFNISPALLLLIDNEGNVIEANSIARNKYGYFIDEGKVNFNDFLHQDDIKHAVELFIGLYNNGKTLKKTFSYEKVENDPVYRDECYQKLLQVRIKNEEMRVYNKTRDNIFDVLINANLLVDKKDLKFKGILITSIDKTEANLMESKFKTILERVGVGYYEVDHEGNLTFFSDELCSIVGYSRGELMGINLAQYSTQEFSQGILKQISRNTEMGKSTNDFNLEITRKDNEKRFVEVSLLPIYDAFEKCIGFRGFVKDITDKKIIENRLIESEERFRVLYKLLPVYSMLIDTNARIIEYNNKFVETWGYAPEAGEFSAKDVVYEEDYPKGVELFIDLYTRGGEIKQKWKSGEITKEECAKQLRGVTVHDEEIRFENNGTIFHISINCSLWFDSETMTIQGILATAMDLSEVKALEERFIDSEKKYRELVEEKTKDIIFTTDINGKFITANKNMNRKLGFFEKDIIGKDITEIIFDDPADINQINKAAFQENINKVLVDGNSDVLCTGLCIHKNLGDGILLQFKLDPVFQEDSLVGMIGFATDLMDDALSKFVTKADYTLEMENRLTLINEIAFRLTKDLPKYFDSIDISLIRMSLSEFIINAIEHGNLEITYEEKSQAKETNTFFELLRKRQLDPEKRKKKVFITFSLNENRVQYIIRDEGTGFDYNKILKKDISDINEEFLTHGRGIITSLGILDEVVYNKKGNEVTLIKYVSADTTE